MRFHVGQKVVCVRSSDFPFYRGETCPDEGRIYTIRDIVHLGDMMGLRLDEIDNKKHSYTDGYVECGFDVRRFRPAVSRKADISIFEQMLLPTHKIREDA